MIPASAEDITLDFDICYDTEDDPNFNVLAYDGATLRISDFTTGRFARANLVEAFSESIVTGSFFHFPKHTPRSSNPNYFQDMSVWAGSSGGFQHVSMRLPGMAGSTVQLRPDYTQDSIGTCADVRPGHTCGVIIDNIVMKSVVSAAGTCSAITLSPGTLPSGVQGVVYPSTSLTATGGTNPNTFSELGSLPTGLTLSSSGLLSGTPTAEGSFPITITSSDVNGCTGSQLYTVAISATATMSSPAPGATLTSSSVTFTWSPGTGVSQYYLQVGKTLGGQEIFSAGLGANLSTLVLDIPSNGSTVFVRLWSNIGGPWFFNDYTYLACSGCTPTKAALTAPVPGSALTSSSVIFSWGTSSAGQYYLQVGTAPGGQQIYSAGQGTNLAATVLDIPNDGSTVFVRLWSNVGAAWLFNDYTYLACSGCTQTRGVMTAPAAGSTLTASLVTFTWSTSLAGQYYLQVGTAPGGQQIYSAGQGTNLSASVLDLPNNGSTVFVRLWSNIGGVWLFNDYTYSSCTGCVPTKAPMVSPPPGSTLSSGTVTFSWGTSVASQIYLQVGKTLGGQEIYSAGQGTNLSTVVTGVPNDGSIVFVRLWSNIGAAWLSNDYTYKACSGCQ
ncbi:MAG: putative Ig domain-containing protein [Acidobacteriia bacterium]|nr:putative Ig domain-containing protein [Terriglobia bacterium]